MRNWEAILNSKVDIITIREFLKEVSEYGCDTKFCLGTMRDYSITKEGFNSIVNQNIEESVLNDLAVKWEKAFNTNISGTQIEDFRKDLANHNIKDSTLVTSRIVDYCNI